MGTDAETGLEVGSMKALARIFGVSYTTIARDWVPRGMPGEQGVNGQPGRYSLPEIIQWREAYLLTLGNPQTEDERELRDRLELAQTLKAESSAAIEKIKLGELEAKFIDKESALAEITGMFHRVRQRIESIPQEVGTTFPPEIRADLIADLKHKLRMVLVEMASWADE